MYNLNDDDFKTAIIKILNELRENSDRQLNEFRSYVTKEFNTIKKNQTEILEMKNTIEEIKKNLDALNSRANNMEERISNLERSEEHTSELQSRQYLVCRLLLEKKKINSSNA